MTKTIREITTPFNTNGPEHGADIVTSMMNAFRNFSMYPIDHVLSIQGIDVLVSDLSRFTDQWGPFSLEIKKDGVYVDNSLLYTKQGDEDGFVDPLVRDGIYQLGFSRGICKKDILKLFYIINKNETLSDKPEGDTVTDLWQADIRHITYQATELFWDQEPLFTFPNPTIGEPEPLIERSFRRSLSKKKKDDAIEKENGSGNHAAAFPKPANLDGPHFSEEDITCNPDDLANLRKMVEDHELIQNEDEILDLLLLVIDEVARSEDLENILSNMAVEFHRIIRKGDIFKAYTIIESVKEYQKKHGWMTSYVDRKVDAFITHVSVNVFKDSNKIVVPLINRNNPDEIYYFKKLCLALSPKVAFSLCKAIVYLESQTAKDFLLNIIKIKTREDVTVIENMLESGNKMISLIGVSLLKNMKDSNSEILLKRMLHHPVEQVRSSALDYFTNKPLSVLPQIFFLIDDSSKDVRGKLMKFMRSKRSMSTETLLLKYLDELSLIRAEKDHLMDCYRVLGECGSEKSITFLKKKLLGGALLERPGSRTFDHRVGALLALNELKNSESSRILSKASKSRIPSVMKAYTMVFGNEMQH